jgi:hypothetical protein
MSEHGNFWENMTPKQKLIAGGAAAAIGIGAIVAFSGNKEDASATTIVRAVDDSTDEKYEPWTEAPPTSGGGSTTTPDTEPTQPVITLPAIPMPTPGTNPGINPGGTMYTSAEENQKAYLTNMANGTTSSGGTANAGQIAWAKAELAADNQKEYLTNMANGVTSSGGAANAGQIAWAKAELAAPSPSGKTSSVQGTTGQTSTSSSKPTSQTSTSSSAASSAAAAANQKTYLQNMAAGKTSDGSAANAGQIAWAKAQLAATK